MESNDTMRTGNETRPLTYTVVQAAALLGISKNAAYEGVRVGAIPSLRIGRRVLVPRKGLERMLDDASELAR